MIGGSSEIGDEVCTGQLLCWRGMNHLLGMSGIPSIQLGQFEAAYMYLHGLWSCLTYNIRKALQ